MRSFLNWACQQDRSGLSRTKDLLNGSLKITKFIFMCNLKEFGVFHCEPQSELKIFPLLFFCKAKPTQYRHGLEGEVFDGERIDFRARAALQRAKVGDGSLFIEKLSQV